MTIEKKIKTLEVISYMCAVVPIFFLSIKGIILVGSLGLILQLPIYLLYRSLKEENDYIKKKGAALVVGCLLVIFLTIRYQYF